MVTQQNQKISNGEVRLRINPIRIIGIVLCVIILIVLIFYTWQYLSINQVKSLYSEGNYEEAEKALASVINQSSLNDLPDKIHLLSSLYLQYKTAKKFMSYDESYGASKLLDVIIQCIKISEKADGYGVKEEVLKVRSDAAMQLAILNVDIYKALSNVYQNDKKAYYPIIDRIVLSKIFAEIRNSVSTDEVRKIQNELNPLTVKVIIAYKDGDYYRCDATLSNVGSKTYKYVKVRITYYDENNEVLTSDWTYAVGSEGIRAGENQQFDLMTKVHGKVGFYRIEIMEY